MFTFLVHFPNHLDTNTAYVDTFPISFDTNTAYYDSCFEIFLSIADASSVRFMCLTVVVIAARQVVLDSPFLHVNPFRVISIEHVVLDSEEVTNDHEERELFHTILKLLWLGSEFKVAKTGRELETAVENGNPRYVRIIVRY